MKVCLLVITVYTALFIYSVFIRKRKGSYPIEKKTLLTPFYPLAEVLIGIRNHFERNGHRAKRLHVYEELHVCENASEFMHMDEVKKFSTVLLLILISTIFSSAYTFKSSKNILLQDNNITRPKVGEAVKTVSVDVTMKNSESNLTEQIDIKIYRQRVEGEELEALFEYAKEYICETIFEEGDSAEGVRGELKLTNNIPNTDLEITYRFDTYKWLFPDGSRKNIEPAAQGESQVLHVVIDYFGESSSFDIEFLLLPQVISTEDKAAGVLKSAISKADEQSSMDTELQLPSESEGVSFIWKETSDKTGVMLILLGLAGAAAIFVGYENKIKKAVIYRERQMILDYPELVRKFTLLLGAGMNTTAAWIKIAEDYQRKNERRYAFDELVLTRNQLLLGVSETKAYENFGKRCRLLPYMRFSTILILNNKKGARTTIPLLEAEARAAINEREETARRLGEEAGTKLLLPMIGMLGIVLALILIPAFMTLH